MPPPSASGSLDRGLWRAAAEFGALAVAMPAEFGGDGGSIVSALTTYEGLGLGSADNGFVFALASQVFATQRALTSFGTSEQLQRWLPGLCAGDQFGAFAMSEPDAGSDSSSISTRATLLPDGRYRLDGKKAWVTLGPVCDMIVVFATTDPELGRWGLTAFIVDTTTPGVIRHPVIPKMGLRNCPFGEVQFDGCEVSADAVLGAPGAGGVVFTSAVEAERAFLYAAQLGAMERVIDRSVERARTRRQFGSIIGSFQAVSHRIAEMKLRHEAARLLVFKAGALFDRGEPVTMAASLAKLASSESAIESALDAVRIHGAAGYTEELGLELELRDAVGGLAYSGTSDIQRNIVAGLLGVDRPSRGNPSSSDPPERDDPS